VLKEARKKAGLTQREVAARLRDPIDQRSFYKIFCAVQRALGIRLLDLYATKDTYISVALTKGANLTWLSEQTGVMESTLRTHYGRFIHASQADALDLAQCELWRACPVS
jgi:transcriptional regulator with XRE-family HTH domain